MKNRTHFTAKNENNFRDRLRFRSDLFTKFFETQFSFSVKIREMEGADNFTENPSEHCHYIVPRKKRRCRMLIKPGKFFCGEHSHLLDKSDKPNEESNVKTKDRIPCPLDPKHSCSAKKLESHLKKCPSKQDDLPDYISLQINVPKETEYSKGSLTVSNSSDEVLLKMISRINDIYEKEIRPLLKEQILKHPLVEKEIDQEHIGAAASKHLVQNSSLLQHLSQTGALEEPDANVIEFGSGRGQLTYWIANASKKEAKQKFLLVDKASHRHKFDNKLKDDSELSVSRIRADIQDLILEKIPAVKMSKVIFHLKLHSLPSAVSLKKCIEVCGLIKVFPCLLGSCHWCEQTFMWSCHRPRTSMHGKLCSKCTGKD